ncbi:putative pyridine nucleotide-disulfide oxidoreductase [Desulfamplus magnetovallimortis]|uniref:Putative pyridine nucleotide-disulfide oxidoreductase n=1 Tax=Desulfamplus magnetovallimortis TaxID=1246637 RepID=A0A1W1HDW3_9BACT|nr:FAD-dependent oxidoreductase [Desulfamplus magnetovallimortis]SLM30660.1 putative pyridine nucleotide-disulfide oxidoreductase [Desulfamplus magnetovallimortis]
MNDNTFYTNIPGKKGEKRIPSRVLEEMIQNAVQQGHRAIEVAAYGQHGIGGRLCLSGDEKIKIRIQGHSGQRTGSLGYPGTEIEVMGPASDDIGWLNAGAEITVHGNASNGAMNGGAQGKVYIGGNIGARGMTMTKHNPRFAPPELWVLGSAGDYFGEFMAGGIAVICGFNGATPHISPNHSVLGYRPMVGMVGGKVFFRGEATGFSEKDARLIPITDNDWDWLCINLEIFLGKINKKELFGTLSKRSEWQILRARTPQEKMVTPGSLSISAFRQDVWDRELGRGGLIGDLQEMERGTIPLITKGDFRRMVPVWEHAVYKAPCQANCPTGIPVQERWHLIRNGLADEALTMGLKYTPFPATVCGHLCPSPCMASCTKNLQYMTPVNVRLLGRAGEKTNLPEIPEITEKSGRKIAVIGAGPGGISAAWHLTLKGHDVALFDESNQIGGKISSVIPDSRIPKQILDQELERVKQLIPDIRLDQKITPKNFKKIKKDFEYVVVAAGSRKPRMLPVPGIEFAVPANDFLAQAKADKASPGKKIVIIGAGNVGCDVATEAHRSGAESILLIDVQKPAAFGKEKEDAEAVGATFQWPCFTREITPKGVVLDDGELLEADTVIISIGDAPDTEFLGPDIATRNGFVSVTEFNQTSDPGIFAIGDIVGPGLITDAIGAGKRTAEAIDSIIAGKEPELADTRPEIKKSRVSLEYFNPIIKEFDSLNQCGAECASCGRCRDCSICVHVCPEGAISRIEKEDGGFEYRADPDLCIGCGFCKGACPCGIWDLVPNKPM